MYSSTYSATRDKIPILCLEANSDNEIEARVVPPNKQIEKLFPTDKKKKVDEFYLKLTSVERLLDFIEKTPQIGDCYENSKNNKFLGSPNNIEAETIRKHTKNEIEVYTLQARHDILEKMPLFLINYINDKKNDFSKDAKSDCMKIITPLIIRCVSNLQHDYSESVYCTNKFIEESKVTTHVYFGKIDAEPDIIAEFLKILGRYYFLISMKFTTRMNIDSCKEQKIISDFMNAFYPKSKINRKKYETILIETIVDYIISKPPYNLVSPSEKKILDSVMGNISGKLIKKYLLYGETDPLTIFEYYLKWIIYHGIFSKLEKEMVLLLADWAKEDKLEKM